MTQLEETIDSPATNGARIGPFTTVRTLVSEGIEGVLAGGDVERVLGQVNDEIDRVLTDYADSR